MRTGGVALAGTHQNNRKGLIIVIRRTLSRPTATAVVFLFGVTALTFGLLRQSGAAEAAPPKPPVVFQTKVTCCQTIELSSGGTLIATSPALPAGTYLVHATVGVVIGPNDGHVTCATAPTSVGGNDGIGPTSQAGEQPIVHRASSEMSAFRDCFLRPILSVVRSDLRLPLVFLNVSAICGPEYRIAPLITLESDEPNFVARRCDDTARVIIRDTLRIRARRESGI